MQMWVWEKIVTNRRRVAEWLKHSPPLLKVQGSNTAKNGARLTHQ